MRFQQGLLTLSAQWSARGTGSGAADGKTVPHRRIPPYLRMQYPFGVTLHALLPAQGQTSILPLQLKAPPNICPPSCQPCKIHIFLFCRLVEC